MSGVRRVLVVSHYFDPHVGGIEVVAGQQARRLAAGGMQVEVLTTSCGATPGTTVEAGVRVRRVRAWNPTEHLGVPFPVPSPSLLWTAWRAARRADVVHVHDALYPTSWAAAWASRLARTRYVMSQHVGTVHHSSAVVRLVQALVWRTLGRSVVQHSSAVLPIDEQVAHSSHEAAGPATQVRVLPNAVDVDLYRPVAGAQERRHLRARHGLPQDVPLVLFVGRFVPKKNFELVAAAVSDDYRLVFVGGDRPVHLPDPRLLFLGELDADQVAEVYRCCDLFIGASVGEAPLTVREAMSSGTPVLLAEGPSYRALGIDETTARYVDLATHDLRDAVADTLADPVLDERARRARQRAVAEFSWTTHMDSLQDVYDEVARPRRTTRVAVVSPYYPPDLGGVERYAQRVAQALAASPGHDAVVLSTRRGWRTVRDHDGRVPVVRLGRWGVVSNSPVSPLWPWQVRRWLRRLDVDVVNAHAPVPFLADVTAAVADRPVVLTYHSGTLVKGGARVDPLLRVYERWVLPRVFARCAALVAVSPVSSSYRYGAELIPGGVDLDRFTPREAPGDPTGPRRLLYVGRVERSSRWKGLHVLLEALPLVLRDVPDAVVEIVGDGDAVGDLRQLAARLGVEDHVAWRGGLHGQELVDAYRCADALVLPSLTDAENAPLVVLEAMACGTPVVASRAGGIPHLVEHGVTGELTEPGDAAALAAACVLVLSDRRLAARRGAAGRARVEERWAWSRQTDRTIALLDRVVALSRR